MDKEVIKNALGGLDVILSKAKRALRNATQLEFGGYDDEGFYENPKDAMQRHLEQLYDHLLVILEAASMIETRSSLVAEWTKFQKAEAGLQHVDQFEDYEHLESPALNYLTRIVSALRMSVSSDITSEQAWLLVRLEEMLDDTSELVHRRVAPGNEQDLKELMHDYLSACFPNYDPNPRIPGGIKNFKPDCGIIDLQAAIEFKFARTKEEAVVRFSGVVEDTGGYKGSKDWTRFYAVIYQAQPFISKRLLKSEMKRIGNATWKAILVNGDISPKPQRKKSKT